MKIHRFFKKNCPGELFEVTKIPRIESFATVQTQINKAWDSASNQFISQWIQRELSNDKRKADDTTKSNTLREDSNR